MHTYFFFFYTINRVVILLSITSKLISRLKVIDHSRENIINIACNMNKKIFKSKDKLAVFVKFLDIYM